MVVMDAASGKVIASMPIGAGVGPVAWDADSKTILFSSGDGILSLFHQKSADEYEDLGPVRTQPGAKTMLLRPVAGRGYSGSSSPSIASCAMTSDTAADL
jgi:hypothetical protein